MSKFLKIVAVICIACLVILGVFNIVDWERIIYLITLLGGFLIGDAFGSNKQKKA